MASHSAIIYMNIKILFDINIDVEYEITNICVKVIQVQLYIQCKENWSQMHEITRNVFDRDN